ncbi:MAG: hypothetical protein HY782_20740 [Chloroflexi bacterium]|nr:hypothetical protein [Chloroflexota bacterium]
MNKSLLLSVILSGAKNLGCSGRFFVAENDHQNDKLSRFNKCLIASAALIVAAGIVMYSPVFEASFWTDDFSFVEMAARLPLPAYLAQYWDPRAPDVSWYRPVQGFMYYVDEENTLREQLRWSAKERRCANRFLGHGPLVGRWRGRAD